MGTNQTSYRHLTWPEIKEAVAKKRVALLPVGSMEGHGPHLPVDADSVIAEGVCRRVAAAIPGRVVVLPTVVYGISGHHMDFPGTITSHEGVFQDYVAGICSSLAYHGFRRILILNGHGGNSSALDIAARSVTLRFPETLCASMFFGSTAKAMQLQAKLAEVEGLVGMMEHAGLMETALYLALSDHPVDLSKARQWTVPDSLAFAFLPEGSALHFMPRWSSITPEGSVGDPRMASVEIVREWLDTMVQEMAEVVTEFQEMQLPPSVDHHDPPVTQPWRGWPR